MLAALFLNVENSEEEDCLLAVAVEIIRDKRQLVEEERIKQGLDKGLSKRPDPFLSDHSGRDQTSVYIYIYIYFFSICLSKKLQILEVNWSKEGKHRCM